MKMFLADWLVEDTGDIVENNRRKIIANSYNKATLDASKVGYCAHVDIEWTCPVCNGKWTDRLDRRTLYKRGCPYCKKTNTSVGEQVLYKILSRELPGKVELHKNINGYEFDICVKDLNLMIEYNGVYYHKSEKARKMDEYKRKLAADHGYSIVTILELTRPCDEDINIYRDFCYIMDSERQACGAREFISKYLKENYDIEINTDLSTKEYRDCYSRTKCGMIDDYDKKIISMYNENCTMAEMELALKKDRAFIRYRLIKLKRLGLIA